MTVASLQGRTFTYAQGQAFEAEMVRTNAGYVELKGPNGATKWFSISLFSDADQRYIKEQSGNLSSMQKMPLREAVFHANQIDRFIQEEFRVHRIQQNAPSTDEQFIRRVYLDTIGLLPEPGEYDRFVADKRPDKRKRLERLQQWLEALDVYPVVVGAGAP